MSIKKINSITIKKVLDDNADTSHLGRYTDAFEDGAIDRQGRGDCGPRQFRYFIPADKTNAEAKYKRMEAINNGDICFFGIITEAECAMSLDGGESWHIQEFQSPGLWGIESDSEADYVHTVEVEELSQLHDILMGWGFLAETIADAPIRKVGL